jgi:hypothetical protein
MLKCIRACFEDVRQIRDLNALNRIRKKERRQSVREGKDMKVSGMDGSGWTESGWQHDLG